MPVSNPAGMPIAGPGTPYITPALLTAAPTGIAWSTLPARNATPTQQLAELMNLCTRATSMIDASCNQVLRATQQVETLTGPGDFRCQLQPSGVTRLLMSACPILSVVGGRVSASASFPRSWTDVAADQFEPEQLFVPSSAGDGGQGILMAPGWVSWGFGRQSTRIEMTYISGWPHASLTVEVGTTATALVVDDITGWDDVGGVVYDVGGLQEYVQVTAVIPDVADAMTGPGTLTLSAGLAFPHQAGVLVSSLPGVVQQAGIYLCVAQALTRGATATAVASTSGGGSGGGAKSAADYIKTAYDMVHPFARVI